MKPLVFLIHGFNSDKSSMSVIARSLKNDYQPITLDLPITFQDLEVAVRKLKKEVLEYMDKCPRAKCYFIGHSTGGIIIRMLMKFEQIAKQTISAIFVAVPNKGNEIAEFVQKLPPLISEIYKPIANLTKKSIANQNLVKPENVLYAGIAGFKSWNSTKAFFNTQNDGVVSVTSVILEEMNDFITLPYDHLEITQHHATVKAIKEFLKTATFNKKIEEYRKMNIGEKFSLIVKENHTDDLISHLTGNIDMKTVNAKVWWNVLDETDGWELQQHKMTTHLRILNPEGVRKGWGKLSTMRKAVDLVCSRIKIDKQSNNETMTDDIYDKIRKLSSLKDEGHLTEKEFIQKKAELLAAV